VQLGTYGFWSRDIKIYILLTTKYTSVLFSRSTQWSVQADRSIHLTVQHTLLNQRKEFKKKINQTVLAMCRLIVLLCFLATVTGQNGSGDTDYKRTVIMIEKITQFGQNLFVRGGIDYRRRQGCTNTTSIEDNPCDIPIKHTSNLSDQYKAAKAWRKGDNYLDWSGAEPGQGKWNKITADGSPAIWTTNNPESELFNVLNTYGDHYWVLDIEMDCSKTEMDFFELKGFLDGSWESDVTQPEKCSGSEGVTTPFNSKNHVAKCGAKNVFHFTRGDCEISKLV
ncbi:hypothetical protein Btru_075218, partial [Bulinus truncatus]